MEFQGAHHQEHEFIPHESRLDYVDFKDHDESGVTLITTVWDNFEECIKKQVEATIKACFLQAMLKHSSKKDFKRMVHVNVIAHCLVNPENISHAYELLEKMLQD